MLKMNIFMNIKKKKTRQLSQVDARSVVLLEN